MNTTTVYKNEMNLVPLKNFTSAEIDLFFAICTKLKDQGTKKVKYDFCELKSLSDYYSRSITRFINDLEKVYDKMLRLTYTERNDKSITKFVLFTTYQINIENQYLEISVNPELEYILNNLTGNFTKFELKELTQLKSSHSKNMFRLLKQFKSTGYFKISVEDFRNRLDIPESYRMSDLDKKVFKYIKEELNHIFQNLTINKVKGKGRKIEYLEFIFEKETKKNNKHSSNNQPYEMTPIWIQNMSEKNQEPVKTVKNDNRSIEERKQQIQENLQYFRNDTRPVEKVEEDIEQAKKKLQEELKNFWKDE